MAAQAWTIGHSTRSAEEFGGLLEAHGVTVLVDVRRHPGSRAAPWTNPDRIADELPVPYLHVPALGGRRRPAPDSLNGLWRHTSFRGYADHMPTAEFQAALEELLGLTGRERPAVMCAEAQWWRCHRRLIADALLARGAEVRHIMGRGRAGLHELTEGAVIDGGAVRYPPAPG